MGGVRSCFAAHSAPGLARRIVAENKEWARPPGGPATGGGLSGMTPGEQDVAIQYLTPRPRIARGVGEALVLAAIFFVSKITG